MSRPIPNPMKRMTANPARPVARYRPGKAVQEDESSDEEEEEEENQTQRPAKPQRIQQTKPPPNKTAQVQPSGDVDDDEDGFVTDEEEDEAGGGASASFQPTRSATYGTVSSNQNVQASRAIDQPAPKDKQNESDEEESEEDESRSEEEESSSEEEAPQRKFQRPTFIKKTERKDLSHRPSSSTGVAETSTTTTDEATNPLLDDEQSRRRQMADLMIKDKLERDALARSQGRKAWDDDDEVAPSDQVDDTDDLDPAAEHAAWRLRELRRLKRDREALVARETELEEVARRRALTSAERDAEDAAYMTRQREEKEANRTGGPETGGPQFMARYHHKGAFFQDDEAAAVLKKRDLMNARFQDDVADKSTLPEYMRIRDMTKLGKKGRTRYTDLRGQDTGRFGEGVKRWRGAGDRERALHTADLRGLDERFLPDQDARGDGVGATGANASALGVRRERDSRAARERSRSPVRQGRKGEDGDDDSEAGDTYRPSRRRRSYSSPRSSRSRSGSRGSPPPPSHRRRRSPSPYRDRDKRRRIET